MKHNILYVDDEKSNLNVFKSVFRRDYDIYTASEGMEGLEIMKKEDIHLVITDQRMPGMTGVEFLKEIKKVWEKPKCVLLTGYSDHKVIKEAINEIGIYRYIDKPYDHDDMKVLIDGALEVYQLQLDKEKLSEELEQRVKDRTQQLEKAQEELKASYEKEKELGELKSRFVATASHQFRTPLTVIQSSIGILSMQMDGLDNDEFKQKFEKIYYRIKAQINRMTELMNNVLILGKINAGNIKPVLKPIDLIVLCKEVITSHEQTQKRWQKDQAGSKWKISENQFRPKTY